MCMFLHFLSKIQHLNEYVVKTDVFIILKGPNMDTINMIKNYNLTTVWLKWIATLCSRYASPPPL